MSACAITPHILELLQNPAAYPVQTSRVELLQTHISWLFLTDTHVFKIKKPVNFGFLDFSTIEQRRFYCHEEVRLNRRLCRDVYEKVVELHETASGAAFAGDGPVLDYAVMMKRLPAERMLDRLIDRDAVSVEEIQLIAAQISHFHATADTSPHISACGSVEQIRFNWQENFTQTSQFHTSTLMPDVSARIRSYVDSFFAANAALFTERINNGYIRDCDGDIHLGNICLFDNNAYIFDCIEFNERFRFSDTAADIAFLLMDLEYHRRPDLADAALTSYISSSGDTGCAELISFYKVYRAFVRGKVESMQLLDAGIEPDARVMAEKRARSYFRLAQGYCVKSVLSPTLFITCGTMGSGKSTLAEQLVFELSLRRYNSDVVRKQQTGLRPDTAVQVPFGEGLYSKEVSEATYRFLENLAEDELAAGHSVVIDAGFVSRAERARFARLAVSRDARFCILLLQCPPEEQQRRLIERAERSSAVSDGRVELLARQQSFFEHPDDAEGIIVSCSTAGTVESALEQLYERLVKP